MVSRKPTQGQIGGMAYTVADVYLWAAIFYLDSVTNYRECISENADEEHRAGAAREMPRQSMKLVAITCLVVIVLALIVYHECWS